MDAPRHDVAAPTTVAPQQIDDLSLDQVHEVADRIHGAVSQVIEGKPDAVRIALIVLLAEGHLLIEDVPGVGKTMLAKSLARSIDCTMRRVQFTPDLLPSDITGVSVFNQDSRSFEFRPGAVFANIVVGDEINRASPKTQSALLECMEEAQVTIDGHTYPMARPFMVMATQNPIEMEGTYPLPEAQRDRFMARISMGYPSPAAELAMLDSHAAADPLQALRPVTDAATIAAAARRVARIYASPALQQYIIDLVHATRTTSALRLGASPRAALSLLRAARAAAALDRRDHVIPEDVQRLVVPMLAHRVILSADQQHLAHGSSDVLEQLAHRVRVPSGSKP
ncbi:AAA family ATPase [Calidifontibacter terrae]